MEELSCVDLIMSWIESDPIKLSEFPSIRKGSDRASVYFPNKGNGSIYESFDADIELFRMEPMDSKHDHDMHSSFDDLIATKNSYFEPDRLLRHQYPAPPPKLHYSTHWRKLTKELYRRSANAANSELN